MKKDIMKEIELKYKEVINHSYSKRLPSELFQLFLELRILLIKQKVQLADGETHDLYNFDFLTRTEIFTVTYMKKFKLFWGLFDEPEINFSVKEEETLKIYTLTQKKLKLINL